MPVVRKLRPEEVISFENRGKSSRKVIEEEYDGFFSEYGAGDYGEAELEKDEKRLTVRNRLRAAAHRRNLEIEFKRTRGDLLRFKVTELALRSVAKHAVNGRRPKRKRV